MDCTSRDIGHLVENCNCGTPQFLHVWTPCPVVTTTGMSPPVQELHLWNLHGLQQLSTTTGMSPPVQELHLWNLHGLQQFCTTTGMSTSPRTAPVKSPRASAVLHDSPRTLTLNVESAKRHANVTHLAHDPILTLTSIFAPTNDRDDMVSALSENCNCGTSTVFCTVVTQAPVVVQQRASQPCPRTAPVEQPRPDGRDNS